MTDTRKKYTKEFKLEAVRMLEAGTKTGREIEQDLGVGSGQVYRWKKLFAEDGGVRSPAMASLAMQSWPSCAKRTRTCARNETSCEKQWPSSQNPRDELPVHGKTSGDAWCGEDGQGVEGLAKWVLRMGGSASEREGMPEGRADGADSRDPAPDASSVWSSAGHKRARTAWTACRT